MSEKRSLLDVIIDKACGREPEPPLDVKHCPFCGGNVVGMVDTPVKDAEIMLMCMSRTGCTANVWAPTLDEAIKLWNHRA